MSTRVDGARGALPRIAPSARKHGVPDEDLRYAYKHPLAEQGLDEDRTLLVGTDRAGSHLLELVVLNSRVDPVVIHGMRARPRIVEQVRGGRT
jgi:hypothetical protein